MKLSPSTRESRFPRISDWSANESIEVEVARSWDATSRVKVFELREPTGWELPPYTAGAHIEVITPAGVRRPYSLCGDPRHRSSYRIGVALASDSAGGSSSMHRDVRPGDSLRVSLPRNYFALDRTADRHVLVAGGIGITPVLAMIYALDAAGADYEVHYATRSSREAAFLEEVKRIVPRPGLHLYFDDSDEPSLQVDALLASAGTQDHVYCCGPNGLVVAMRAASERHAKSSRLHVEQFDAVPVDVSTQPTPYTVNLTRSGRTLDLAPGTRLSDALIDAGLDLQTGCLAGICGLCKVRVLDGDPVHRDAVLSQRERSEFMTSCVSGCASAQLVLDL